MNIVSEMNPNNITLINVVTGTKLIINMAIYRHIDALKAYIQKQWNIPTPEIFIMLPFGLKLKNQDFKNKLIGVEVLYVFHRRIFSFLKAPPLHTNFESDTEENIEKSKKNTKISPPSNGSITAPVNLAYKDKMNELLDITDPIPNLLKPLPSPFADFVHDEQLRAQYYKSFAQTNLGWLNALYIDVKYYYKILEGFSDMNSNFIQGIDAAVRYLEVYYHTTEKSYREVFKFYKDLQKHSNASNWVSIYKDILSTLKCVFPQRNFTKLADYFDFVKLTSAYEELNECEESLNESFMKIDHKLKGLENIIKGEIIEILSNLKHKITEKLHPDLSFEDKLFSKFKEYCETVKDMTDTLNNEYSNSLLGKMLNDYIPQLSIMATSLYSKATQLLEDKRAVQLSILEFMGIISFIQVEALKIKDMVTEGYEARLELYKKLQLNFGVLEDFPVIYGLYLIELYRRKLWAEQLNTELKIFFNLDLLKLKDDELKMRNMWLKDLDLAGNKKNDNDSAGNSSVLLLLTSFANKDCDIVTDLITESDFQLEALDAFYKISLDDINEYLTSLKVLGVNKVAVDDILLFRLQQVVNFKMSFPNKKKEHIVCDPNIYLHQKNELLRSYKLRIQRLEAQLHIKEMENLGSWPAGIFKNCNKNTYYNDSDNQRHLCSNSNHSLRPFETASVNSSLILNNSVSVIGVDDNEKLSSKTIKNNDQALLKELNFLKLNNKDLKLEIQKYNSKISDLETESKCYKDALNILNEDYSTLASKIKNWENKEYELNTQFQNQLKDIVEANNANLQISKDWKSSYEEVVETKNNLLANMQNMQEEFNAEKNELNLQIENYQKQLGDLMLKTPRSSQIAHEASIHSDDNPSKQLTTSDDQVQKEDTNELEQVLNQYIIELFNIVINDIFLLENIGLLLERDCVDGKQTLVIKRVKGLRKRLEESTSTPGMEIQMNSSLITELKFLFQNIKNDASSRMDFLQFVRSMYGGEKIYENSVMKRFKDIEMLAKKLTKDIKKNKQNNGLKRQIAVKDFQVGDLALFLPARLGKYEPSGYSSSVNSSLSSIDLTSPTLMRPSSSINSGIDMVLSSKINSTNININHHHRQSNNNNDKDKDKDDYNNGTWAVFTITENIRYFVQDPLYTNEEWFIGEITKLEKHIASQDVNPFRLDIGTVWYSVSVNIVYPQSIIE
ncbi:uncharacterized protein SCODWIG_03625 [Saccharomycodes ludwigii]|uniref:Autophagy-related protein 11 n=1 Tax=Saccharomycodes ludwigii TaxID=36035 RepID=A0A376BBE4_9ASCO|nr:uncharacterized protein SCODWIG_03625 [Saccharomycodes ludwigii]